MVDQVEIEISRVQRLVHLIADQNTNRVQRLVHLIADLQQLANPMVDQVQIEINLEAIVVIARIDLTNLIRQGDFAAICQEESEIKEHAVRHLSLIKM
jgi:hypothetical protein